MPLVALLGGDIHLPHTEEVPTDLVAEVANVPPEAVVLEVANHLGVLLSPGQSGLLRSGQSGLPRSGQSGPGGWPPCGRAALPPWMPRDATAVPLESCSSALLDGLTSTRLPAEAVPVVPMPGRCSP